MRHSQKGASFFGWLALIGLIIFGLVIAMKLVPIYLDHFAMREMITKINEDPTIKINSIREFNSYIDKGLQINSIRDIDPREAIKITASGSNAYTVQIAYEVRTPALQNVDLLVHFDETHIVRPIK